MIALVGGIVVGACLGWLGSEYTDWGIKDMVSHLRNSGLMKLRIWLVIVSRKSEYK